VTIRQLQRALDQLSNDASLQRLWRLDRAAALDCLPLTAAQRSALGAADIGLLHVLGVGGQRLLAFAAFVGLSEDEALARMRDGERQHGPVRAGAYGEADAIGDAARDDAQ